MAGDRTVLALPVVKSGPVGKGMAWSVGSYGKTDSSVTLDWDGDPLPKCGGAYEVRLDETGSSVTIQLVPGKQLSYVNKQGIEVVCGGVLAPLTMSVPLSAPVGSRSILQQ